MEGRFVNIGNPAKPVRLCAHCGRPFVINPRRGKLHRFCTRPACAQVSRQVAQQNWLKKNGGKSYFLSKNSVENVRAWRKAHPQYWKRTGRRQRTQPAGFRLTRNLKAALRCVALQDVIDTRLALEIGIISRLSGAALQDEIASEILACILRGNAILRGQRSPRMR
jgi:hypothetical protein